MTVKEELLEVAGDEDVLLADGWDEALIGWTDSWSGSSRPLRAVYSATEIIRLLVERDGLSLEEANEHFEYNIAGAYVGETTPVFVWGPR